MTTLQTEYTAGELLMDLAIAEPLVAGGVRCHGGFDADGNYVSPRTRFRVPAIEAWQVKHREDFGKALLDVPLETWPENFPNVAQARFLVEHKVPEPLIAALTRIGTVEGFGANIRYLQPSDFQRHFVEDIRGTAIDHLGRGLFEAHGRDEAGFEAEAGHRDMWFAARDIAFEGATADIDIEAMLDRMGFGPNRQNSMFERILPDDIDVDLELTAALMVRVLLIEIQAFHTFAWAEAWLADPDLVAGEGEAARLVSYIRRDETPHVGYLKTALTEMRDRTWIGASGARYSGEDMVGRLWARGLEQSLGAGRRQNVQAVYGEIHRFCTARPGGDELLEELLSLGSVRPDDLDGDHEPAVTY